MRPEALIARCCERRSGEPHSRRLADQHLEASYRLACAILGNAAEAQDATHDAFVQAWRKWSTLRDHSSFEPWFDRILVNTCRNRLKRNARWRSEELTDDVATAKGDPFGQALDRQVLRRRLVRVVAGSPAGCRAAVLRRPVPPGDRTPPER